MTRLRILVLLLNFFIIIGAGHGIGILGLIEMITVHEIFMGDFSFKLTGYYDDRLMTVGLFTIIGQSFLISSFFFNGKLKSKLSIIGCLILLITIYVLSKDSDSMNLDMISLISSIPFIVTTVALLVNEVMTKREAEPT